MKKRLLNGLLLVFTSASILFSCENKGEDQGSITFETSLGNDNTNIGHEVIQTTDNGYAIVGYAKSSVDNENLLNLIKTDVNGNVEYNKTFPGKGVSYGNSVCQTSDGGLIICGDTKEKGGNSNIFLLKTDINGEVEFEKTFGDDIYTIGRKVQQTMDGGYIIVGERGYSSSGVYLVKTDSKGEVVFKKIFYDKGLKRGESIQQTMDGGYIIIGHTYSDKGVFLLKTDENGNLEFEKFFGEYYQFGEDVLQTMDGGYVMVGLHGLRTQGSQSLLYLTKTDEIGNIQFEKTFLNGESSYGESVVQTKDGGFFVTGYSYKPKTSGSYDNDVFILKTDGNGILKFEKTFGTEKKEYAQSGMQTSDGGYIITGKAIGESGKSDFYLIKTDPQGNVQQ